MTNAHYATPAEIENGYNTGTTSQILEIPFLPTVCGVSENETYGVAYDDATKAALAETYEAWAYEDRLFEELANLVDDCDDDDDVDVDDTEFDCIAEIDQQIEYLDGVMSLLNELEDDE